MTRARARFAAASTLALIASCGRCDSDPEEAAVTHVVAPAQPNAAPEPNPAAHLASGEPLPRGVDIDQAIAADPEPKPPAAGDHATPSRGSKSGAVPAARGPQKHPARPKAPAQDTRAPSSQPVPAPSQPVAPKSKTAIPNTTHVRAELGAGLRSLLDADPRMQPWVNSVFRVADRCFAAERSRNPFAKGTIVARITMHANERPDVEVQSLPAMLAGVVACATGDLSRTRMPLFTGPEGQKHTVRLHFTR